MGNPIHKDLVFQMLKKSFQVNLFYKPTMESGDDHYHIIIDNVIKMTLVVIGNNFIVIDGIQPLTSSYIHKIYDTLIDCLINQTEFTVLIQRLGDTHAIDDACVKHDVPIVVDDRFITIPKKLYNMYMRYYGDNQDSYGFYLLAVNSDLSDIPDNKPEKKKPEPKVKKIVPENPTTGRDKKILYDPTKSPEERIVSIFDSRTIVTKLENDSEDNTFLLNYLNSIKVYMTYKPSIKTTGIIEVIQITKIEPTNDSVSAVLYMELLSKLEDITDMFCVELLNVKNRFVYDVCQIRQYPQKKNRPTYSNNRSLGSYVMKKYEHGK